MKPIDILLVYPEPSTDSPVKLTPLSILYPGALFAFQGKTVAYFDERYDSQELFDDQIRNSREIGVSAFTGVQAKNAARLLKRAKNLNEKIVTGLGGHHARLFPEQCLAMPYIDKIWTERVYGEHLFPFDSDTEIHYQRTEMQYFTSRGCPYRCTFCALSSPWEPVNINRIERELKTIHDRIGFETISFSDPNIACCRWKGTSGKPEKMDRVQRIRDIGSVMRSLDVKWDGNIRSPYLTPQMVEALDKAQCYSIEIGCESGSDHYLRRVIGKGHGIRKIKEAVRNVCGSNVSVMYSFMAKMPGETREMLMETLDLIDWIVQTDPNARVSIYNYAPYPGSPMYEAAVRGEGGYPKYNPPTTLEGWGDLQLMNSPLYWIAGLNFRDDNTKRNFPGEDWDLIEPYVRLAREKWSNRDIDEYPVKEVEEIISNQIEKMSLSD